MHPLSGRLPARMTIHTLLSSHRSPGLSRIVSYAALGIAFLASRPVSAQQLPDVIADVGAEYAELYLQPVVNAFGADINAGLIHTAKVGGGALPFDLFLGIKVMGALIPDIDRTLDIAYENPLHFPGSRRQPVRPARNLPDKRRPHRIRRHLAGNRHGKYPTNRASWRGWTGQHP